MSESKFYKIPHLGFGGVEVEKFNDVKSKQYDKFTITYAGSFYEGWIEPYEFLEGLSKYVDRHSGGDIQAQFYGDWKEDYQQKVRKENLEDIVTTYDPVPHDEIIRILKGSDLLLYVGGNDQRNKRNISLKIADYVAAESPILGVIDRSFRAGRFIEKENIGIAAHPREADSIADAIREVSTCTFEYDADSRLKDRFDSQEAMAEYAAILNAVSTGERHVPKKSI
jgi:glycosyltransferase involved in cell wall biosynthesis